MRPAITSLRTSWYGFSLLELAVTLAILAVLAAALLPAVLYYEEMSEKTEVQLTILNIRSGLRQQLAERMFQGRMHELQELSRANPVLWLERPPARYAGELRGAQAESAAPGSWYFEADRGELRYRPRLHSHLEPELDYLSWKVMPVRSAAGPEIVESLVLANLAQWRWF